MLNQLQWRETPPAAPGPGITAVQVQDVAAENTARKRAIMSSLLRNLGAAFRAGERQAAAR